MDEAMLTFGEELVAALDAASRVGERLPPERYRLCGAELGAVLAAADRCHTMLEGALFTLVWEAHTRGEVAASQAGSTAQWLAEHAPGLEAPRARVLAKAVARLAQARWAAVREAVMAGDISAAVGVAIRAEFDAMARRLQEGAQEAVIAGLLAMGRTDGVPGVRQLRPALLARYGLGEDLQEQDDRAVGGTTVSAGRRLEGGLWDYRVRLTDADRAIVEAALNALSRPDPDHPRAAGPDGTRPEQDPRTPDQRRGDALVEVCRRTTALASSPATAAGMTACLFITIHYDDVKDRTRGGTVVGTVADGTVLGPETVRRFACDAGIIPVVLGGPSEVLDVGTTQRLFTTGQVKTLWLRDRRCTFPGCTVPATWCEAHHLRHWIDHGPTNLGNAALLCGRHHTIVHRDRLAGRLTPAGTVVWDRTPGSYEHALTRWRARERACDPDGDEPPHNAQETPANPPRPATEASVPGIVRRPDGLTPEPGKPPSQVNDTGEPPSQVNDTGDPSNDEPERR